ncbi:MAG: hypothetical protein NDI61_10715 [Bdellovibrionaceae bacterium]|nr:hypothetical protein [Pseudobdellovibrionaceae bacterium]
MSLLEKNKQDVGRALQHLDYSYKKILGWDFSRKNWSEEELEVLEGFSSRFARTSDLVVSRLLRSLALAADPAFRGSLIDLLNLAEKFGWISSAKTWYRIRELRNVAAHEYSTDDFNKLLEELRQLTPVVFEAKKLV